MSKQIDVTVPDSETLSSEKSKRFTVRSAILFVALLSAKSTEEQGNEYVCGKLLQLEFRWFEEWKHLFQILFSIRLPTGRINPSLCRFTSKFYFIKGNGTDSAPAICKQWSNFNLVWSLDAIVAKILPALCVFRQIANVRIFFIHPLNFISIFTFHCWFNACCFMAIVLRHCLLFLALIG